MHIGDRLTEEQRRLGLGQSEMAKLGCVSRKTQFNYETGVSYPSADYLARLASAGVDVLFVITGNRAMQQPSRALLSQAEGDSKAALTVEERALVDNYRNASDEGRRAIEATSSALAQSKTKLKPAA